MPLDAEDLGYISMANETLGNAYNTISAANTNEEQRKWTEMMYKWQRGDALADWQMQNQYNSPAAQMKRYTEAGLNPHLIYGSSNQNGPVVRSTNAGSYNPEAPKYNSSGITNALSQFVDMEARQAQTNNVKLQAENIKLDSMLKAGQLQILGTQTERTAFDLAQLQAMGKNQIEQSNLNLEATRAGIQKTQADTQYTLNQDERSAASNAQSLLQGIENIQNLRASRAVSQAQRDQIRQQTENLKTDNSIKQLDKKLTESGIRPGTSAYENFFNQLYMQGTPTHERVKNILNTFDKWLPDWLKVNAR